MAEGDRCFECSCTAKESCTLKSHSEACGATPDAIPGEKVVVTYDVRHPSIIHDRNKCIKCGICIKICSEVIEKTLLGFKKRGFSTEVGPAFGLALPDSCGECMACVEECPVGALDRKIKK
jgi:formate dehydrogenase major subunit